MYKRQTLHHSVSQLLFLEAQHLDRRDWDAWLALYTEDAVYWAPSWACESETVSDPEVHLNLIYLRGREALADRVFRIRTLDSLATVPMDRTVHIVGTVIIDGHDDDGIEVGASWLVHSQGHGGTFTRGGFYEYRLHGDSGSLRIARKKITLIDDRLEGPVDVYHL